MKERVVDTREYVSILRGIAEEGKVVSLRIAGSSMSPFLCHERDWIYFTRPDRALRRGDMVFYQRDTGQYVMHRIYQIRGKEYYMLGDAQTCVEGPLRREQIFALIVQVKRKGKILRPGNFWWECGPCVLWPPGCTVFSPPFGGRKFTDKIVIFTREYAMMLRSN